MKLQWILFRITDLCWLRACSALLAFFHWLPVIRRVWAVNKQQNTMQSVILMIIISLCIYTDTIDIEYKMAINVLMENKWAKRGKNNRFHHSSVLKESLWTYGRRRAQHNNIGKSCLCSTKHRIYDQPRWNSCWRDCIYYRKLIRSIVFSTFFFCWLFCCWRPESASRLSVISFTSHLMSIRNRFVFCHDILICWSFFGCWRDVGCGTTPKKAVKFERSTAQIIFGQNKRNGTSEQKKWYTTTNSEIHSPAKSVLRSTTEKRIHSIELKCWSSFKKNTCFKSLRITSFFVRIICEQNGNESNANVRWKTLKKLSDGFKLCIFMNIWYFLACLVNLPIFIFASMIIFLLGI